MCKFIARQPIFQIDGNVYGYKLLYREANQECYTAKDGDMATSTVIAGNFLSAALESLTEGKKAFINFTPSFLRNDIATLFPPEYLVVEIMESEMAMDERLTACKRIKALGYIISVGDFALQPNYRQLLEIADIIKVDFQKRSDTEKEMLIKEFKYGKKFFLAEKVENHKEYNKAIKWGYTYFQGYFFSKPETVPAKTIPPSKWSQIRLLNAVNEEIIDFGKIAEIIEMDAAFSYEILCIVNSSYFSRGVTIKTIKHAVIRLGIADIKKWCYITALRKTSSNIHDEIIAICMIRAKFLEAMSTVIGQTQKSSAFITVGIFSGLDVLLGASLATILAEMHLSEEISNTLLGENTGSELAQSYQLILACEKGAWQQVAKIASQLGVEIGKIAELHNEAIKWVVQFEQEMACY